MGFFSSFFGGSKPERIRQRSAAEWPGNLAGIIASMIQRAELETLKISAAYVCPVSNAAGLCEGVDGNLPTFDPGEAKAFVYLKDVEMWPKFYETISKLLVLDFQSAKMLADATKEPVEKYLASELSRTAQFPMIDQFAFAVAKDLEEKVGK